MIGKRDGAALPVIACVRQALAFARANVHRVVGALVLVMALNVAGAVAASYFARGATLVATLLAGVMANGALLRLAFADLHPGEAEFKPGFQGFQFGAPELRLLGALLLLGLFGVIALLFMVLLAALLTVGVVFSHGGAAVTPQAMSHSPEVQAVLSGLVLVFMILGLWIWARVFTYPAATVAERRVQVFSTWRLTGGNALRILAAVILLSIPAFLTDALLMASPAALVAPAAILSAAVHAFVEVPLLCGLSAAVYRRLHTPVIAPAVPAPAPGDPGLAGPWG